MEGCSCYTLGQNVPADAARVPDLSPAGGALGQGGPALSAHRVAIVTLEYLYLKQ